MLPRLGQIFLFLLFVILILGLYLIISLSNNTSPFLKNTQFVEKFSPLTDGQYRSSTINSDKSVTYYYPESKIDAVETKNFLLKTYVVLSLKARIGAGYSKADYKIELPANLQSIGSVKIFPSELKNSIGKLMSFDIDYTSASNVYTFYDIKSWRIDSLQ